MLGVRSAIHHLDLLPGDAPAPIDVVVAGRGRALSRTADEGIRVHLPRSLGDDEVTTKDGIRVTTAPRTLADFAAVATPEELATAVHRAQVRGLLRHGPAINAQLQRRVTGITALRRLIEPTGPDLRGEFERALHRFVRAGGWPPYKPNVRVRTPLGSFRADALWQEHGFAIELDSWSFHADREHFEGDRRTVLAADAVGIDLKRLSWLHLHGTPAVVADLLDRKLGRPPGHPG